MLRYKTETRPGLVALYIRPGNGAGPFLQPRSPHGALIPRCCHVKFGCSATKGVCIKPQNWGVLGPGPLWVGPWLILNISTLPTGVVTSKFSSSASKGVCRNRREPQKLGVLGQHPLMLGAWLTWEIRCSPSVLPAEFGHSTYNGTSVIKEILLKIWPIASFLSRTLKGSGTDTARSAIRYFLLKFHSNNGPILYRFREKWQFQSTITNFSHLWCIWGSRWRGYLGIGYWCIGQKITTMWLLGWESSLTIPSAIWIQSMNVTDRTSDDSKDCAYA